MHPSLGVPRNGQTRPWLDLEPQRPDEPNRFVTQLAGRLYLASQEAARRTMARYVAEEDHDLVEAAQSAGAAIEYLMRAVLCVHDPVLVAARNDTPSIVALSRANTGAPLDVRKLRTVTYGEALEVLREIHPALGIDADVRSVMNLRNGAAHMAMTDRASLKDAAVRLVQVVSKIHGVLNRDVADYWGRPLAPVIQTMQDEHATALARTIEAKFARARQFLTELTRDLTPGDAEAVLIAREARAVRWAGEEEEEHECPVCQRNGRLEVASERGDPYQVYYSDDISWAIEIFRWPTMFQCPVCDLLLEDEELGAAGLPLELESRHEAVDDPYWEPDEDFIRGR